MPKATMPKPRVIWWIRTDLRLHDSPALKAALDLQPESLYPVWTWDPHYVRNARVGVNRWQFLLDSMQNLSDNITKLNPKSRLHVVREAPQTVMVKLLKSWKITHLVFEKDTDAYARERDKQVRRLAEEAGVTVIIPYGRTLYDPDRLVQENHGKPTMTINQVQQAGEKIGPVPKPLPTPTSLPDPGDTSFDFDQERPPAEPDLNSAQRNDADDSYASLRGPLGTFSVPTMEELSLKPATTKHRGGETLALELLDDLSSRRDYTATFSKPSTAPTAFAPQSTTLLSPHLHFGTLSVRALYWAIRKVIANYKNHSLPPTSLIGQLQFRDMYFGAQAALGYPFAQTYANPTAHFIPWHLPSRIDPATGLVTGAYDVDSPEAEAYFRRWKWGRTGFPWIDALMRQLRTEGWIHHLGRHAVACFLTRGGCYVDWERGAEVFEEWLIDHETACNAGNWQWLSCTAFFSQYYRCYSPIAFPQKWDPDGAFVRHYVPELARFDKKYIYEPWRAPIADQKRWGCLVTGDGGAAQGEAALQEALPPDESGHAIYPKPMFDFPRRREACIAAVKKAYDVGLHGNDDKVKDGSWRKLFDDDAEGPTEGEGGPPGLMLDEGRVARTEAGEEPVAQSPEQGKKRGRKRAGGDGQTTLDGAVKKTKK